MKNVFKRPNLISWLEELCAGGNSCALQNCSQGQSLWRRVRARRHGIRFNGVRFCSPECLETALLQALLRVQNHTPTPPPANRMPLGLLMVARGKLTYEQVSAALAAQKKSGTGNIGEWFEKLGFLSEQEVTGALGLQWGCPVSSSLEFDRAGEKLPLAVLESFLMWPLHYVSATNTQYVAFGRRVDHTALYAIERMLGCRVQPCVAPGKLIIKLIERLRQEPRAGELEFHRINDSAEIVRIASSYIAKLGAEEVRMTRVGDFIWLLLKSARTTLQLLFRLEAAGQAASHSLSPEMNEATASIAAPVWRNTSTSPFLSAMG